MDINNILDSLGLDLSNPEAKRGAVEAINAILASRTNFGGGGAGGAVVRGGEFDVELDPDLIQPSEKHQPQGDDNEDIEINDEDNILDQIKRNDSEDDFDNSDTTSSETENQGTEGNEIEDSASSEDSSNDDSSTRNTDENGELEKSTEAEDTDNNTDSSEDSEDENIENSSALDNDVDDTEDNTEAASDSSEEVEIDGEDESNDEFDEDDLLDNNIKGLYDDEDLKAKHEARKIKRERTLQAANKALADAKARKAAPALIRELEKAILALEALTEAISSKSIKDISDEEFNLLVNRVFDAIEAVGDNSLTFTSEQERELQAKEIKNDLASTKTQQELSAEDIAQIRAETQAIKARDKETDKYRTRARSSFKGFQDFLSSLYRAIALQVHVEETQDDTWSAINRRHSGTNILQPGKKLNELPNKKIPVIDFYFDCSSSWNDRDLAVGQKAVDKLIEMEENGQIKINIFYFSDSVYTDVASARAGGNTAGWNDIVKNVIATQATNVIIMTDSDMEDWWRGSKALSYTVPGYVWYLWRDGENAPRLPRDLKGRGGTQQFSFSHNSV